MIELTVIDLDQDEFYILEYYEPLPDDENYDGYFCVQTVPFNCRCRNRPWTFVHWDKRIIVWKSKDDQALLQVAHEFKDMEFDPHIIEYNSVMGNCVDWQDIPAGEIIGE